MIRGKIRHRFPSISRELQQSKVSRCRKAAGQLLLVILTFDASAAHQNQQPQ